MENKELLVYRARLLDRIGTATQEFCDLCRKVRNPFARIEEGWNTHQVAAHVRDVDEVVYGIRIRRTINENVPVFSTFDADTWVAGHYRAEEPLEEILADLETSVSATLSILQEIPDPTWSRMGRHEINGEFPLQYWVERALAHTQEHIDTLKKAIGT
jgi:hypothetical protein